MVRFVSNQVKSYFYKHFTISNTPPLGIYFDQDYLQMINGPKSYEISKEEYFKMFDFSEDNIKVEFFVQTGPTYYDRIDYTVDKNNPSGNAEINNLYKEVFVKCKHWHRWFMEQQQYLRDLDLYSVITFLQYTYMGDKIANKSMSALEVINNWAELKLDYNLTEKDEQIISLTERAVYETGMKFYDVFMHSPASTVLARRKYEYILRFPLLAQFMRKNGYDVKDSNKRSEINMLLRKNYDKFRPQIISQLEELVDMFRHDLNSIIINAPRSIEPIFVIRSLSTEMKRAKRDAFKSTTIWNNNMFNYKMFITITPSTPLLLLPLNPRFGDEGEILLPTMIHFSPVEFDSQKARLLGNEDEATSFYTFYVTQ